MSSASHKDFRGDSETDFGCDSPFILVARVKVKEGCRDEYLDLALKTDKLVQDTEPGMLHHTFDVDPEDDRLFCWSEMYLNDAAFFAHLANPAAVDYLEKHEAMSEVFTLEVYGSIGDELAEKLSAFSPKIHKTCFGFTRLFKA